MRVDNLWTENRFCICGGGAGWRVEGVVPLSLDTGGGFGMLGVLMVPGVGARVKREVVVRFHRGRAAVIGC